MTKYPSKKLVQHFIPLHTRILLYMRGYGRNLKILYSMDDINLLHLVLFLPNFAFKRYAGKEIKR